MSLEKFIKENINNIGNDNRIYIAPYIDNEKLQNTINTICKGIDAEDILAIYDSTVFGSSKEGLVFTKDSLFYREPLLKAIKIKYKDIKEVTYEKKKVENKKRKFEMEEMIVIKVEGEKRVVLIKNVLKVNLEVLSEFINNIINEFVKNELDGI